MSLIRAVASAFKSLWDYKARSVLALLGMAISSLLIVFLLAVLYNFKTGVEGEIQGVGLKQIVAMPGRLLNNQVMKTDISQMMSFTSVNSTLTYQDAMDVQKEVPHIVAVAPQTESIGTAINGNTSTETLYTGTTPGFSKIFRLDLAEGRWLNDSDVKNESQVIVLGSLTKKELFGNAPAVGKKIQLKGLSFTVVGVLKEKQLIGFNFDERAYTTYKMVTDTTNAQHASMIFFDVDSRDNVVQVERQIGSVIEKNHGVEDFSLVKADEAMHVIDVLMTLVTAITSGISGVSFLVGGIGIMNVMLLVVKERTREIGLRKAVGARSFQVLFQFLTEAVLLSLIGTAVGLVAGYGVLKIVRHLYPALPAVMPMYVVEISLGFSIAIGLVFGCIPAFKAVRIQPVEALRYE